MRIMSAMYISSIRLRLSSGPRQSDDMKFYLKTLYNGNISRFSIISLCVRIISSKLVLVSAFAIPLRMLIDLRKNVKLSPHTFAERSHLRERPV